MLKIYFKRYTGYPKSGRHIVFPDKLSGIMVGGMYPRAFDIEGSVDSVEKMLWLNEALGVVKIYRKEKDNG